VSKEEIDVLSDFTVIVPLKSKTAEEVNRGLLNSILQQFNVEKLHSDNGKGFRGTDWLESMSALGIKVIASSSLHPQGRGQIERLVGTVKLLLKKVTCKPENVKYISAVVKVFKV
jgi:transposase InsO family protein